MSTTTLTQAERKQIVSILSELKDDGATFGRRHRRRPVRQYMWIKRLPRPDYSKAAAFKIRSEDVSLKGLGFVTRRQLAQGELVVAPLQFREGGGMLVLCRICFCRNIGDDGFRAGAEFVETLPDPNCKERIPQKWLKLAWTALPNN